MLLQTHQHEKHLKLPESPRPRRLKSSQARSLFVVKSEQSIDLLNIQNRDRSHSEQGEKSEMSASNSLTSIVPNQRSSHPNLQIAIDEFDEEELRELTLDENDIYRLLYAETLFRVGALTQRAELLKGFRDRNVLSAATSLAGYGYREFLVPFDPICYKCQTPVVSTPLQLALSSTLHPKRLASEGYSAQCPKCDVSAIRCLICDLTVDGLSTICLNCFHGGHPQHIKQWFESQTDPQERLCPLCGCHCVHAFPEM